MSKQTWWHIFSVQDPDTGIYISLTIGPSLFGADAIPPDTTGVNAGLPVRDWSFPLPPDLTPQRAGYRASFDHEPTTDDTDSLAPVGYRSWEQDYEEDQS